MTKHEALARQIAKARAKGLRPATTSELSYLRDSQRWEDMFTANNGGPVYVKIDKYGEATVDIAEVAARLASI